MSITNASNVYIDQFCFDADISCKDGMIHGTVRKDSGILSRHAKRSEIVWLRMLASIQMDATRLVLASLKVLHCFLNYYLLVETLNFELNFSDLMDIVILETVGYPS